MLVLLSSSHCILVRVLGVLLRQSRYPFMYPVGNKSLPVKGLHPCDTHGLSEALDMCESPLKPRPLPLLALFVFRKNVAPCHLFNSSEGMKLRALFCGCIKILCLVLVSLYEPPRAVTKCQFLACLAWERAWYSMYDVIIVSLQIYSSPGEKSEIMEINISLLFCSSLCSIERRN